MTLLFLGSLNNRVSLGGGVENREKLWNGPAGSTPQTSGVLLASSPLVCPFWASHKLVGWREKGKHSLLEKEVGWLLSSPKSRSAVSSPGFLLRLGLLLHSVTFKSQKSGWKSGKCLLVKCCAPRGWL